MNAKDFIPRIEKLKSVVEKCWGGKTVKILITQLDPDAMGAAIGMRYWLDRICNIKCQIYFCGGMDHPQNRSIFTFFSLGLAMKPIADFVGEDMGDVILVDSNSSRDVRIGNKKFRPVVVIDHHAGGDLQETDDVFYWVEPVGAASTLVGELLKETHPLRKGEDEDEMVATMMCIGIASDTHDFKERVDRCRDRAIWDLFMEVASEENYGALMNYDLPSRYYELNHQVTDPAHIRIYQGSVLVAWVGMVTKNESAFLAEFADLLLRRKDIQTVLVWAPVEHVGFVVKMRTVDASESLIDRLQEIFSSGGAKTAQGFSAGGTTIRLEPFLDLTRTNEATAIKFFSETLDAKLMEVLK